MPPVTPGRPIAKRCYQKCDSCRRKKIKCTPEDREDFLTSGRKCDQCFAAGEPCSANTRVPRRSIQNQNAATPLNALSPNISFSSLPDAEGSQLALRDLSIYSPIQTSSENVFSPAQSQVSNLDNELWRSEESPYILAQTQIREMGLSVELYEYCQQRKSALLAMMEALTLLDLSQAVSSLDMVLHTVFMPIMTTLRNILQVLQRPVHLSSHEFELLSRRVLDIGNRLSRCGGHFEPGRNSNFNQILSTIKMELIRHYMSQNDSAEVNRLQTVPIKSGRYLEGLTYEALPSLSKSLLKNLDAAVGDVLETSRKGLDLDPGQSARISATHLVLMSDRLNGAVTPEAVGLDMSCDMTGRNALHIAAERADVGYVEMWLKATQNDPQLLSETKDKRDVFRLTPLMISAYQGSASVFRLLLEAGANPKLQTPSGKSLLSLAAMAGNEDIVAEILVRGIQVQEHITFCSPIHDAAATGRSEAIISLLLEHKAEPRYEHHEYPGQRASQVAEKHKHHKIAQALREAEKKLDTVQPISDASELILKDLQQKLTNHIANSNSPGSPSNTVSTSRRSPSIEPGRRVKRQRSIHYEYHSSPMSSTTSTPRVLPTNPMGPSPLAQVTNRPFNTTTSGNLDDATHSSLSFFMNPSSDYSILDLDAYCNTD